ncbi:transposase (plasmid) [Streptomyces sp. NBC_00257]|uniref:transposase n=1 Tax=unclassified Streptomyces TaxID=2593676 RepID=UPI002256FE58|nr:MULTISPECIES: transposase [unclassified Streptomyces]MCX4902249.1 transposase [Streptomyces sp. NBC_00892]MCX5434587.1 transposase [Streptomyces sp. NBC_00062]
MQVSHTRAAVSAAFDDANLIAHAGLVPVMRLAERYGLPRLVRENVRLTGTKNGAGASAYAKVTGIVGGMAAGADSIDDLDVLRHGAMSAVFEGVRAPSTLGTFLRSFTHGHALQLHAVHRRFLGELAAHTPLLPGSGEKAFIDVDSTHKRVYGRTKQGGEYGRFKGIRTLHPLLATICTPASRPVIATVRMRRGKAADSRGAPKFISETLATAVEAGCTGMRILRSFCRGGVCAGSGQIVQVESQVPQECRESADLLLDIDPVCSAGLGLGDRGKELADLTDFVEKDLWRVAGICDQQ